MSVRTQQVAYQLSSELIEIPVKDLHAVYHRTLGGLCLLDSAAREVLHGFISPQVTAEGLLDRLHNSPREELIQQFLLRGFLVPEGSQPLIHPVSEQGKVSVIQLIVINHCNFGCKYCFLGAQGNDTKNRNAEEEVKRIVELRANSTSEIQVNLENSIFASRERLEHQYDPQNRVMTAEAAVAYTRAALEISKHSGTQEVMVQFFGGEPMLNWRACKAVLQTFGREAMGLRLRYSTVTNGSQITDEIAKMLADYEVAVCVSFDSESGMQRPLKDGSSSAPVVKEGLRKLQKYGNYIAINAALTSDTWDEFGFSVVRLAHEYGAKEIGVVIDFDPAFYEKHPAGEVLEKLWPVIEEGARHGIVLTGYWHQIFQILANFDAVRQRGFKNCSAKGAQLSVEPNGSVFSCKAGSGFYGSVLAGPQLLQTTTYRAHANLRHQNPSFCEGCEIEGFCAGLCLGPIEKKYGSVDAVEPAACGVYRGVTRKLIQSLEPYQVATFELGNYETNRID